MPGALARKLAGNRALPRNDTVLPQEYLTNCVTSVEFISLTFGERIERSVGAKKQDRDNVKCMKIRILKGLCRDML